jgi:glycosyltransferase involved in cell wall biosynthesis
MTVPGPVVWFYTPLKPPDDREVSGDREIARALLGALQAVGLVPEVASRLLTWRRTFDPADVVRMERRAAVVAARLVARCRRRLQAGRPALWLTYQNYHRCPDLIGPVVATALGLPYVLVDTAVSGKPRRTAFRPWLAASRLALRRADLIFAMSPRDLPALARIRGARFAAERLRLLPPAVDPTRYVVAPERRAAMRQVLLGSAGPDTPLLLCVAMMRAHDKLDSYRLLAGALGSLLAEAPARPWRLVVAGDGPARPRVEAALAAIPRARLALLGTVAREELPAVYAASDCLAFPGVGEALGLVYVEAAAAGLPVVACHGPGPDAMAAPGGVVLVERSAPAFAAALRALLDDGPRRRAMGIAARRFAEVERSLSGFQRTLADGLRLVLPGRLQPVAAPASASGVTTAPAHA